MSTAEWQNIASFKKIFSMYVYKQGDFFNLIRSIYINIKFYLDMDYFDCTLQSYISEQCTPQPLLTLLWRRYARHLVAFLRNRAIRDYTYGRRMVLTQLLLMLLVDKHMVTLHLLLIITGDLFWCNQTKRELLQTHWLKILMRVHRNVSFTACI